MKTLIVYDSTDGDLRFTVVDGDYSRFGGLCINGNDEQEHRQEFIDWFYNEEGQFKFDMKIGKTLLESKDWDKVAIIIFMTERYISWHYHYVHGQKEIKPGDTIDTTLDKMGRFHIRGYIKTNIPDAPPICICIISHLRDRLMNITINDKTGDAFSVEICSFKGSIPNFCKEKFFGKDPVELMEKCEKSFQETRNIFLNSQPA